MDRVRVVIVSGDPLTRSGLASLLARHEGLTIAGSAALAELDEPSPLEADVALVDLASLEADAMSGHRMGIPTVNGTVCFDPRYLGNPLVFAGSLGLIPRNMTEKAAQPGDRIVLIGKAQEKTTTFRTAKGQGPRTRDRYPRLFR